MWFFDWLWLEKLWLWLVKPLIRTPGLLIVVGFVVFLCLSPWRGSFLFLCSGTHAKFIWTPKPQEGGGGGGFFFIWCCISSSEVRLRDYEAQWVSYLLSWCSRILSEVHLMEFEPLIRFFGWNVQDYFPNEVFIVILNAILTWFCEYSGNKRIR